MSIFFCLSFFFMTSVCAQYDEDDYNYEEIDDCSFYTSE